MIGASGKVAPFPSSTAATRVRVSPAQTEPCGEIDTDAAGGSAAGRRTTILALSLSLSLVATTQARPGRSACNHPLAESTRATAGLVENQLGLGPGRVRPD